jgi:hypothetical protein
VYNIGIDERPTVEANKRTPTIMTNSTSKNKKTILRKASDQVSIGNTNNLVKEDVFVKLDEDPETLEEE